MKRILFVAGLAAGLGGCAGATTTPPPAPVVASGSVTPANLCQAVALVQNTGPAASLLNSQAPSSTLGVLWADLQAGCPSGVPASGVSESWTALVAGMFKQALPTLLPLAEQYLLPLVAGILL